MGSMPRGAGGFTPRRLLLVLPFLAGIVFGGAIIWSLLTKSGDVGKRRAKDLRNAVTQTTSADSGGARTTEGAQPVGSGGAEGGAAASLSIDESRRNAIVRAAQTIGPSVVSISVVQTRYVRRQTDPFGFFDRYFPSTVYRERVSGLGSGFIIDRAGVILTNEHVIHEAEQIKVTLTDGRTFDAKVIGSDPGYDLAVLKISGGDLTPVDLGNSDDILVGEWAIAIGNPFGFLLSDYQPSVSVGVISAKGRDIKSDEQTNAETSAIYKNMIQTDAAINPGNSGGPLVNGQGKVIGINTFIFTETGGSVGIGFAIPINVAVRVVKEILQYGEVRHAWTGIKFFEITPYIAAYYNIADPRGLLVFEIEQGGPGYRAGIQVGDIIRRINGEAVRTSRQASLLFFDAAIGDVVTLSIDRAGRMEDKRIRVEAEPRRAGREP